MKNTPANTTRAQAIARLHELRNTQPEQLVSKAFIEALVTDYKAIEVKANDPEDGAITTYKVEAEHRLRWASHEVYNVFVHRGDKLVGALQVSDTGLVVWDGHPLTDEQMLRMPTGIWRNYVEMEMSSQIRPRLLYIELAKAWFEKQGDAKEEREILAILKRA